MVSNPIRRLTEEQYLTLERAAETKSEFLDGEMFGVSGANAAHARLQADVLTELSNRLRGGPCEVFGSDMRIKVSQTGLSTYPDVSVVCGDPLFLDAVQDSILNPTVIIEVLSPSTELYDRGRTFQHYRTLQSLKDYILVSQEAMLVEHYSRQEGEAWTLLTCATPESELRIASIGVAIPLREIYRRVKSPAV